MSEYESLPERLPPRVREFLELLYRAYPNCVSFTNLPERLRDVAEWCMEGEPQRTWVSVCCVDFDPAALPTTAEEGEAEEGVGEVRIDLIQCVPKPPQFLLAPDGHDRLSKDRLWDVDPPPEDQSDYIVRLSQAAAVVSRSKRTLERWVKDDKDFPLPDVEGGGGKANEWKWSRLRPYLEAKTGKELPKRFPADSSRPDFGP